MKSILLIWVLSLVLFACNPQDHVAPEDTCQLARMVSGSTTNDFLYDEAGQLTRWVITKRWNATTTQVIQRDFIRNRAGRISSMTQTGAVNGQNRGTANVQFSYANGLLVSTSAVHDGADTTRCTFRYDSKGRMIEQIVTDPRNDISVATYQYDTRGNCTERAYRDSDASAFREEFTYDTSKNPEQLLRRSLPFDLQTDLPWSVNTPLTVKRTNLGPSYPFQEPSIFTSKRTDLQTDAKGYVLSTTLAEDQGSRQTTTYSLMNCQ